MVGPEQACLREHRGRVELCVALAEDHDVLGEHGPAVQTVEQGALVVGNLRLPFLGVEVRREFEADEEDGMADLLGLEVGDAHRPPAAGGGLGAGSARGADERQGGQRDSPPHGARVSLAP